MKDRYIGPRHLKHGSVLAKPKSKDSKGLRASQRHGGLDRETARRHRFSRGRSGVVRRHGRVIGDRSEAGTIRTSKRGVLFGREARRKRIHVLVEQSGKEAVELSPSWLERCSGESLTAFMAPRFGARGQRDTRRAAGIGLPKSQAEPS